MYEPARPPRLERRFYLAGAACSLGKRDGGAFCQTVHQSRYRVGRGNAATTAVDDAAPSRAPA